MAKRWSAVLARLGTPTGDGRVLMPGGITSRDLPLPLMWQKKTGEGHSGAVTVGVIENISFSQDMVTAEGRFLGVRGADEASILTDAGVTGPSVDLFDDVDSREAHELIKAGVIGPDILSGMDDVEYVVDEDNRVIITKGRIAGATLVPIPAFADVSIHLNEESDVSRETPALVASLGSPELPPASWFEHPEFDGPTPLTVTDEGRVYGHVAPWGECHVGMPGCTTAPASSTNYAHFLRKEQPTDDGAVIPVGVLTVGGGHADPSFGYRPAQEHYDDPDAAVAKVSAGEDEYGIWVSGWVLPYANQSKVQQLADLDVSGDWRRIGGNLELIAVCAVNTPGFPVLKKVSFSMGRGGQQSLVATFKIKPPEPKKDELSEILSGPARADWARAMWNEKGHV